MQIPLQVAFNNVDHSEALESKIREKVARLERINDRITSCRVTVDAPHRHHHKGQLYEVHIELHIPGGNVVVNRKGDQNHAHEDPYVAVRDAFEAATRQLEEKGRHKGHRGA